MTYGPGPHPWGQPPNPADGATQAGWPLPPAQPPTAWPQPGPPPQQSYQPWPPGAGGPGGQFGPPPGPPGRSNRKPLIIGLSILAAVVLVVVVVVVVVVASSGGGSKSNSAGDTVKGYLEALARGDATAALSYSSDQPGSKDFLTDEILKKQIARWPITDIKILGDSGAYTFGQVHVSAKFGDNISDVTLSVKKNGGDWKIDHAAVKVDNLTSTENKALDTLTFFGSSVGKSPAYVFPGFVDAGSTNPNVAVKMKKPLLLDALTTGNSYYSQMEFSLSPEGESAIMSSISNSLNGCTASRQLAPPDCPQRARDSDIVDGTVTWGQPDLSGLKISFFDQYHLDARVSGDVMFPLTAGTKSGGTKSGTVRSFISAKADVAQSPPVVSMR